MYTQVNFNPIGGVMVSMLALSVVDFGFKPWSGQTKDYKKNCGSYGISLSSPICNNGVCVTTFEADFPSKASQE
jgi:hypothetical protein